MRFNNQNDIVQPELTSFCSLTNTLFCFQTQNECYINNTLFLTHSYYS